MEPFRSKAEQHRCELRQTTREKLKRFGPLDGYGEYKVEFIGHLIELMMIMEKTGMDKAFVFKELMDSILREDDIFTIVAKATQVGK